jgi:DNA-binding transcriptional LysR family regulator
MVRDELSVLSALMAVAEERSFARAAKRLGVSPDALSHAISGPEEHPKARSTPTIDGALLYALSSDGAGLP